VKNDIEVGSKAPDFTLPDMKKRNRSLQEFLGQKAVLVFFVGAFIESCTKERCEFRDSMARLIDLKVQIVGIDVNVPYSNKTLAEKHRLPFPILSDYKHEVLETYGLEPLFSGKKGEYVVCCWATGCYPIAHRSIFVLDEEGIVRYKWVSEKLTDEPDYNEIENALGHPALGEQKTASPRSVITISKQLGSGGEEIASRVSAILNYDYFDKDLMGRVAKSLGSCEEDIPDFSEDAYKVKSNIDKMLRRKQTTISIKSSGNAPIQKVLDEEECLSLIQTIINSLMGRGKTVIVGRGGQAILKDKASVLHVRIIAPTQIRIERIMKSEGLNREAASKLVDDRDKASAEYLRRFYGINWEDQANYDLVLNTGKLDFDAAARIIATLASPA